MNDTTDMGDLTNQAEELLGKLGNLQSPEAKALGDRLSGALASTKSALSNAGENVSDAVKNALVSTDDFVHDNPWIAVGVVAGVAGAVGFLAGLATAPKSRFWR